MPSIFRTVEPATEPVSVSEAKAHLRVTDAAEDTLIGTKITEARQMAENELRRSLDTQSWQLTLDEFPDVIELPYPPIIGVSSVQYIDAATGILTTLSAASYKLDARSAPARLVPAWDYDWPTPRAEVNAVTVTYTAGYGNAAAVPEAIKGWIKLMVGHLYEHREASAAGATATQLPFAAGLLDPYRVFAV